MICGQFFRLNGLARSAFVLIPVFTLISASFLYATPPAPTGGTLTVITVPERAEVWINNGYAGLTPIRDKQLAEGTYTLRLVDPLRQNSASETIVISEGERLIIERTLGGSYGKLRIDTDPQGADVAIIADIGKTPLVNDYLTPGEYRLEIRHPNSKYMPLVQDVSFADGQPVTISHKLEKPPVFTKRRLIQLGLGVGAVTGFTLTIIARDSEWGDWGKDDTVVGILIPAVAAALSVTLQITIFIW